MFLKVREKIGEQDHITYVNLSFIDEFRIATAPVLVGEDLLYKVILGFTRSDEGGLMFKTLIETEPCKKENIETNISNPAPTMDKLQPVEFSHTSQPVLNCNIIHGYF